MRKSTCFIAFACVSLSLLTPLPARAGLAEWSEHFDTVEVQREILSRIFQGQIGTASEAKSGKEGSTFLFPRGGMWVSLGASHVYQAKSNPPFMIVSCMVYQRLDRKPMSAVSYLLRDDGSRPLALTGGYSANENASAVELPLLRRVLILIESSSPDGSRGDQLSATLFAVPEIGSTRLKAVWSSPRSLWKFRFGFDALGSGREALVLKALSGQSSDDYFVYRWDGERFNRDEFTSEGTVEALGEDVWKYGSQP